MGSRNTVDVLVSELLLKKGGFKLVSVNELPVKKPECQSAPLKEKVESKPLKTKRQSDGFVNQLHDRL